MSASPYEALGGQRHRHGGGLVHEHPHDGPHAHARQGTRTPTATGTRTGSSTQSIKRSREGLRAVSLSLAVLGVAARRCRR